jgi:hypothetical protein
MLCACPLCMCSQDPPNLTYLLDIIEQGGEHMVRSAYWDCGDWSDLWQACRVSDCVCVHVCVCVCVRVCMRACVCLSAV